MCFSFAALLALARILMTCRPDLGWLEIGKIKRKVATQSY